VHSQGTALAGPIPAVPTLDLQALQAWCSQGSHASGQLDEVFKAMGIEEVFTGSRQVLAKLSLPAPVPDNENQFVLHPGLMDSALQVSLGLTKGFDDFKPVLPFELQELEIFGNCTPGMWTLVRYADGSDAKDKPQKFDIDLCDEGGTVCVRMKGLSSRVPGDEVGTLMLQPSWKEQTIVRESETPVPGYVQHLVILCEPVEKWKLGSKEAGKRGKRWLAHPVKMIDLLCQQEEIEQRFQNYALRVFEEIQNLLKDKPKGKVLVQVVVSTQDERQLFSGLSGLLKTARLENPKLIGQLIEVDPGEDSQGIIEKLEENSRCPGDAHIRYQEGKRWVAGWTDNIGLISPIGPMAPPWKDRGVYLITGGAGSLGLIFAREITRQVKDATLILTGRSRLSALNQDKQAQLKELAVPGNGARIEYKQVDITQKQAVVRLFQTIREDFGDIHGIIHSAGVIRDNFILKKTGEELQEVLAPKVSGLVNLDQASKGLNLDFFIFFSSMVGGLGNIGQADYSTANAFMDAYARYRNALVASKQRRGQTLSINWPLWNEGGMRIDAETEKFIRQEMGIIPMQTTIGIQALYQALASGKDQVMVIQGSLKKLRNSIGLGTIEPGQFDHAAKNNEIIQLDDQFYRDLSEKISKGQLSEDQLEKMIMG
jgi:NAD(P)-dependent dehydrogenase (short-subunit alcohol dehydrogenase family)